VYITENATGAYYVKKQTGGTGSFVSVGLVGDDISALAISAAGNWYTAWYLPLTPMKIKCATGVASTHNIGDTVQGASKPCVYLCADHPVKSIDGLFLINLNDVEIEVTSLCTKYTGQGGANDLAEYEGKAVVVYTPDSDVGVELLFSGDGYQDDVIGTYTGVASSLIERPDHVFRHFLYTYASRPIADFVTDAAMPFSSDGYKFSMVLQERKQLKDWLAYMAFQCRCFFRYSAGKAHLIYRPDSLTSDKTITAAMIRMDSDNTTSTRISRSPLDEIVNKVSLYYKRDWSRAAGREAYQAIVTVEDATSIAAYGEKEKPDTFLFDFFRDATMAADLAAFYLARYKDRKKKITIGVFLDNSEIEFADAVMIAPLGLTCEVRKVNFQPGSGMEKKNDMILLEMREY
jgi:hypothetical protein